MNKFYILFRLCQRDDISREADISDLIHTSVTSAYIELDFSFGTIYRIVLMKLHIDYNKTLKLLTYTETLINTNKYIFFSNPYNLKITGCIIQIFLNIKEN